MTELFFSHFRSVKLGKKAAKPKLSKSSRLGKFNVRNISYKKFGITKLFVYVCYEIIRTLSFQAGSL